MREYGIDFHIRFATEKSWSNEGGDKEDKGD